LIRVAEKPLGRLEGGLLYVEIAVMLISCIAGILKGDWWPVYATFVKLRYEDD
jgi:hypothetical protein